MKIFARTGDSGLPMPHPSICLYSLSLKLKTVFFVTLQRRRLKSNFELRANPLHNSEPAKHLRENPSHSFTWRVLSSAQTFHKRRIVKGLMIQQLRPSLNKQVISYVSKLFPFGNYIRYICMCGRSSFLTLMMTNSRKRLV